MAPAFLAGCVSMLRERNGRAGMPMIAASLAGIALARPDGFVLEI
jgi:hypothetical protein